MDLMIDIETLGTGDLPIIATIGYCRFNPHSGMIYPATTIRVDMLTQSLSNPETKTVLWWMEQDPAVVKDTFLTGPRVSIEEALLEIRREVDLADHVWAKGTDFDLRILQESARYYSYMFAETETVPRLIPFWKWRDCRTLYDLIHDRLPTREGPAHDAGADATYQTKVVCAAFSAARVRL